MYNTNRKPYNFGKLCFVFIIMLVIGASIECAIYAFTNPFSYDTQEICNTDGYNVSYVSYTSANNTQCYYLQFDTCYYKDESCYNTVEITFPRNKIKFCFELYFLQNYYTNITLMPNITCYISGTNGYLTEYKNLQQHNYIIVSWIMLGIVGLIFISYCMYTICSSTYRERYNYTIIN
jgi:hypothetical protein